MIFIQKTKNFLRVNAVFAKELLAENSAYNIEQPSHSSQIELRLPFFSFEAHEISYQCSRFQLVENVE